MSVASCTSSSSGSRPSSPDDDDYIYASAQITKLVSQADVSYSENLFNSIRGMQRPDQIAYTFFIWTEGQKFKLDNPAKSVSELSYDLSKRWKTMDYRARFRYYQDYRKFRKEFAMQHNSYSFRKQRPIAQEASPSAVSVNFKKPDLPYFKNVSAISPVKQLPSRVNVTSVAAALGLNESPKRKPKPWSGVITETSQVTITRGTNVVPSGENINMASNAPSSEENPYSCFSSAKEALDSYYIALCEPAFPRPGEQPLIPYDANFCYEAFMKITDPTYF